MTKITRRLTRHVGHPRWEIAQAFWFEDIQFFHAAVTAEFLDHYVVASSHVASRSRRTHEGMIANERTSLDRRRHRIRRDRFTGGGHGTARVRGVLRSGSVCIDDIRLRPNHRCFRRLRPDRRSAPLQRSERASERLDFVVLHHGVCGSDADHARTRLRAVLVLISRTRRRRTDLTRPRPLSFIKGARSW